MFGVDAQPCNGSEIQGRCIHTKGCENVFLEKSSADFEIALSEPSCECFQPPWRITKAIENEESSSDNREAANKQGRQDKTPVHKIHRFTPRYNDKTTEGKEEDWTAEKLLPYIQSDHPTEQHIYAYAGGTLRSCILTTRSYRLIWRCRRRMLSAMKIEDIVHKSDDSPTRWFRKRPRLHKQIPNQKSEHVNHSAFESTYQTMSTKHHSGIHHTHKITKSCAQLTKGLDLLWSCFSQKNVHLHGTECPGNVLS